MNKKRALIYVLCAAAVLLSVIVKQRVISAKRNKETVTVFSEWQMRGRPVVVETVEKSNVKVFTKMTVTPSSPGAMSYEGYVPADIRKKLASGQGVFLNGEQGEETAGQLVTAADAIDVDTGMFYVQIVFDQAADLADRMVVFVNTGMFHDVVCVSNDVLSKEGGRDVVWTAVNGRAHQKSVTVRERNGYGAIVDGLEDGEQLIVQGFTKLSEDDLLNILDGSGPGEMSDD